MSKRDLSSLVILTLFLAPGLVAQEVAPQSLPYVLTGESLPKYVLVEQFFLFAQSITAHDGAIKQHFYDQIGIESGGKADEAFTKALSDSRALFFPHGTTSQTVVDDATGRTDVFEFSVGAPGSATPADFDNDEYRRQKVERLGAIYGALAAALGADGGSIDSIEAYIRAEVATSTSMASDKPLEADPTIGELSALFEATVRAQR